MKSVAKKLHIITIVIRFLSILVPIWGEHPKVYLATNQKKSKIAYEYTYYKILRINYKEKCSGKARVDCIAN